MENVGPAQVLGVVLLAIDAFLFERFYLQFVLPVLCAVAIWRDYYNAQNRNRHDSAFPLPRAALFTL